MLETWLAALDARHRSTLTSAEFLKALRALSARYVERRSTLADRSPIDSAGKRAAFAAFYAPLHLLTVQALVRGASLGAAPVRTLLDLGCGTGVASAAWALELPETPMLFGIDTHAWATSEARWNWRQLGLRGEVRCGDLVEAAERLLRRRETSLAGTGVIAGWSVNEIADAARARLLPILLALAARGAGIVVIEPLARSAAPWWDAWAVAVTAAGGRAGQWKFDVALPPALAELDRAAGFTREGLGARSLSLGV